MKSLKTIMEEQSDKDSKKKNKDEPLKFIETDPQLPFPNDTIGYLRKEINKLCKDLSINWKSPIQVVNTAFNNLNIPIPKAYLKERWSQYSELFGYAIKNLLDSRGFGADWSNS